MSSSLMSFRRWSAAGFFAGQMRPTPMKTASELRTGPATVMVVLRSPGRSAIWTENTNLMRPKAMAPTAHEAMAAFAPERRKTFNIPKSMGIEIGPRSAPKQKEEKGGDNNHDGGVRR